MSECLLTLSVFIAQNVALPNFGVANHQQVQEGTVNRSLSKNPSTRFTICSFTETEDSNPVIYSEVHILHISSPYVTIILSVKFCQPGFPVCENRFYIFLIVDMDWP